MLFIKETPAATLISMAQAIEAVEESLVETARGNAVVLPRRRIHHTNRMLFGVLPGSFKGAMGAYLQTDQDRAIHHESVILYSVDTGEPLILFQDCGINELRTGAAGGVGARYLAPAGATRVAVIGSEKHAFTQLEAVCAVRAIEAVRVFSPTQANRRRFAERAGPSLDVEATAVDSAEAALEGADIVITATNAQSPVVDGRSLDPGMHVTSIANGDKTRVRQELDHDAMRRAARVCVTSKATVEANESDLFRAARDGVLDWEGVCELGDVILGNAPGRTAPEEITLFKLQGMGIMDLAVGLRAYEAVKDSASAQRL